ncbi:hypothetical protein DZS_37570 [Dickeya ananatis]
MPDPIDDVVLAARILQHGVMVKPLSSYYLHPTHQRGLLLGYAGVDEAEMVQAFDVILRCLRALETQLS